MGQENIDARTLRDMLESGERVTVVDVRKGEDQAEWSIPGSVHFDAYDALNAGGEATLWEGRPGTVAEEGKLVATFRASREEAYRAIVAGAERVRRKAEMGGGAALAEQLGKLEREFRAERRRDYFRSPLRAEAAAALKAARLAVRSTVQAAERRGAEGRR